MQSSQDINELATALSKAQGAMESAKTDGVNPFFSTQSRTAKYATLAQVWDTCRKPLTDNGLAVVQPVDVSDAGVVVRTRLMHTSGQWIESALTMPVEKRTAQGIGSAITYGRRYGLCAMVGVVSDEDDDGNAASDKKPVEERKQDEPPASDKKKPKKSVTGTGHEFLAKADTFDKCSKLITWIHNQHVARKLTGEEASVLDVKAITKAIEACKTQDEFDSCGTVLKQLHGENRLTFEKYNELALVWCNAKDGVAA